jgi:hypothetical protein
MPLEHVRRREAISKREFHTRLRRWITDTEEPVVGDPNVDGRTPWVHVRDGDRDFHLHADTSRSAVRDYLRLVDQEGDDLAWTVVPSQKKKMTAVSYGDARARLIPFYLYYLPE